MKALETIQQVFVWLCICPVDENSPKAKKLVCIALSGIVLAIIATMVIGSTAFVMQYASDDLERSLYAFYQIFGWAPIFYMFVVALVLRHKINALFGELSIIYDTANALSKLH